MKRTLTMLGAVAAAVALTACGDREPDDRTAGQKLDSVIAKADRETEQMQAQAERAAQRTREAPHRAPRCKDAPGPQHQPVERRLAARLEPAEPQRLVRHGAKVEPQSQEQASRQRPHHHVSQRPHLFFPSGLCAGASSPARLESGQG